MRAAPGNPPQDGPSAAALSAAHNAEQSASPPALGQRACGRERNQNWTSKGPLQVTATRAVEAKRVCRERLSGQGQSPEKQDPEQGAALRPQGSGLPTPGQRPGAETITWSGACPAAGWAPRGQARALQTPCREANGTGVTKSSEKPNRKHSCVSLTNLQQQPRRTGQARCGRMWGKARREH